MIMLDIHRVKSISARASSHGSGNNWVTLQFQGDADVCEITLFFDTNKLAAEAYAAAINEARIIIPVDEQRAA